MSANGYRLILVFLISVSLFVSIGLVHRSSAAQSQVRVLEASHETGAFAMTCSQMTKEGKSERPNPTGNGTSPQQPAVTEKKTETQPSPRPRERLQLTAGGEGQNDPLDPLLKQRVPLPKPNLIQLISDKNFAGIFIIKFVEGSHVRYGDDGFHTGKDQINKEESLRLRRINLSIENVVADLVTINKLIRDYGDKYGFRVRSAFQSKSQDPEAQFKEKEALEIVAGEELADLDLYYAIAAADFKDLAVQEAFMNELNRFASIELVEGAFVTDLASRMKANSPAIAPLQGLTPDLSLNQTYLNAAPTGIDARYAWGFPGGRGDGVKLSDVEYDWVTDHEDFAPASNLFSGGRPTCAYDGVDLRTGEGSGRSEHGTAVMGILNAPHNGFGVSGIVPNIRYGLFSICRPLDWAFAASSHEFVLTLFSGESVAGRTDNIVSSYAINDAASAMGRGDVLLIEQHTFGPVRTACPWSHCDHWGFVAMEYYQHCYDVIRRATARGIIVVEGAGNGGQDFDGTQYLRRFDPTWRHSGAILVGASNGGGDTTRASFSNFGRRIDLNGWGFEVTTLGYGVGPEGPAVPWNFGVINRLYTDNFNGTSSAVPIVAGAVASIQGMRRAAAREVLNPFEMRTLLEQTGTPQTRIGTPEDDALRVQAIGRQPNLRAAVDETFGRPGSGGFAGPGTYNIQARHSGKILDVNIDWFSGQDNGRPVGQFDNNNGDHQKFTLEPVDAGYFTIRARHSGKCLDVTNALTMPGTGLQQWQCNGGTNQQFAIEPVGDFYRIRARHSGLYFDIAGLAQNNGARLLQYTWTGGSNQLFRFIPTR